MVPLAGSEPTFAGKPGRQVKPIFRVASGALVDNWHMCVKNITVSSRENQAMKLIDGNEGYWQSSGAQGKVGGSVGPCGRFSFPL